MSAYDGAAGCELVAIFIFYQLSHKQNKNNIGLYRDDGFAVFNNISGPHPQADKIKKHFQNIFRINNLNIIVKCNIKTVDYLEVTLNTFIHIYIYIYIYLYIYIHVFIAYIIYIQYIYIYYIYIYIYKKREQTFFSRVYT